MYLLQPRNVASPHQNASYETLQLFTPHDIYLVSFSNRLLELFTLRKLEYFLKYYWIENENKQQYNL